VLLIYDEKSRESIAQYIICAGARGFRAKEEKHNEKGAAMNETP
jgi:hypothetical protein